MKRAVVLIIILSCIFAAVSCGGADPMPVSSAAPESTAPESTAPEIETTAGNEDTSAAADTSAAVPSEPETTSDYGIHTERPAGFTIPVYAGEDVIELDGNRPRFADTDLITEEFIEFSELDTLGRCGCAAACIGRGLLPTVERGQIGMVRPSGWQLAKYDFIDGKYLFNRCHLIAYELCGVNDDVRNLITGTRSLNINGMLPIENRIADYVANTGNHVCYRVTPWFEGDDLVASGVQMEAYSVEDHGEAICLNVFCFNVQQGVVIDYLTGENALDADWAAAVSEAPSSVSSSAPEESAAISSSESKEQEEQSVTSSPGVTYILNTNPESKRFHYPYCDSVKKMNKENKWEFTGTREEAISMGYVPCGNCRP